MRLAWGDVENTLAWLAHEGLLTSNKWGDVTVITLLSLGADVARGRGDHEGIERPIPMRSRSSGAE